MKPQPAAWADAGHDLRRASCQFERDNTGGNGDDSISKNHQHAGETPSQHRVGRDVPIANGGDRDHGPVHGRGNASEPIAVTFDFIHEGPDNDHGREDDKQKHGDFPGAGNDCDAKSRSLANELRELQYPEDAE